MYRLIACLTLSIISIIKLNSLNASLGANEELTGPYQSFKPGYEKFSPVNGILVLESNILANVRFNGRYGHFHPDFLCHYAIKHPHGHEPTAHMDSPHDHTCSVIQQLFPSAAGGRLVLPSTSNDFFARFPVEKVAELIVLYHLQSLTNQPNLVAFERFFYTCFGFNEHGKPLKSVKAKLKVNNPNLEEEIEGWHLNSVQRKNLIKKHWRDFTAIELARKYARAFHGSIAERSKYPVDLIESSLLAFACMKAQSQKDLLPMMEVFRPYLREDAPLTLAQFNRAYFELWKEANVLDNYGTSQIKLAEFQRLLSSPDELVYLTLAENQFGSPFPRTLGTATATHTYMLGEETKYESFSDCGESSSRSFFNFVLASPEERRFILTALKENFPNASRRFIQFYEGDPFNDRAFFQPTYDDVNGGSIGRSAWADVVSSLNTKNDLNPVKYKTAQGRCNIAGIGFSNMLCMISKVLGDDLQNEDYQALSEAHRRAHQLTYLLSKLYRPGHQLSWGIKDPKTSEVKFVEKLNNYPTVVIMLNKKEALSWIFMRGHFEARMSQGGGAHAATSNSWRNNLFKDHHIEAKLSYPGQHLLSHTPHLPAAIKAKLISFYDFRFAMNGDQELHRTVKRMQAFPLEALYGQEVAGAEDQLQILDRYLTHQPEQVRDLICYWYKRLNLRDPAILNLATALWFQHQKEFDEFVFNKEEGKELQRILRTNFDNLKKQGAGQFLFNLSDEPYTESLLIELIKNIDSQALIDLREEDSDDEIDNEDMSDQAGHAEESELEEESENEVLNPAVTAYVPNPHQYPNYGAFIESLVRSPLGFSNQGERLLFITLLEKAGLDIIPNRLVIPFILQNLQYFLPKKAQAFYALLQQPEFVEMLESEVTEESNFTEEQRLNVTAQLASILGGKEELKPDMIFTLWNMERIWRPFTSINPLYLRDINITRGPYESPIHIPMLALVNCPLERLKLILNTRQHIVRFQPSETCDLIFETIKAGHSENAGFMLEHPLIRSYYVSEEGLTEQGVQLAKQLLETNANNSEVAFQSTKEFLLNHREFMRMILEDTRIEVNVKENIFFCLDIPEILADAELRKYCLSEEQMARGYTALNINVANNISYSIYGCTGIPNVQILRERNHQRLLDLLNDNEASSLFFYNLPEEKLKEFVKYFSRFYTEDYETEKSRRLRQEGFVCLPEDMEGIIKVCAAAFVNNPHARQRLLRSRPTYSYKYDYAGNRYRDQLDLLLTSNGIEPPSLDHITDDSIVLRVMRRAGLSDAKKL